MCRMICILVALLAGTSGAAEELRQWKSKTGTAIEASFVKEANGVITLKRKDGVTVQAKLDALCEEDGEYVRDITYVPQEIAVVFRQEDSGYRYVEKGESKAATIRDTVVIKIDGSRGDAKPEIKDDSTWKIESVDAVGKKILPKRAGDADELTTEDKFVFVTYRVKNDSLVPIDVPSPALYDVQGRRFCQTERRYAQYFIPEGALFAGSDSLQPGLKKLFSAFYELPEDAVPAAVEVFPSVVRNYMFRQTSRTEPAHGKKIMLEVKGAAASSPKQADEAPSNAASDGKTSIFMRCTRVGQSGDTSSVWYYDRSKKRSLAYGIELRVLGKQQKQS